MSHNDPRRHGKRQDTDVDMTPMIDCVFLLMIFFVLVIDLSQQDLEDLVLPQARHVEPDDNPPSVRPIINILQDGTVVHRGNEHYIPDVHGENYQPLLEILTSWRNDPNMHLKGKEEVFGRDKKRRVWVCEDPVLIRADKWTEWHYVGKFMAACSKSTDCAFTRLELAMSEQDKELRDLEKARAQGDR